MQFDLNFTFQSVHSLSKRSDVGCTETNRKDVHWIYCVHKVGGGTNASAIAKCLMLQLQLHITSHGKGQNKQHIKCTSLIFSFVYHFFAESFIWFLYDFLFCGTVIVFDFISFFSLSSLSLRSLFISLFASVSVFFFGLAGVYSRSLVSFFGS